MEYIFQILCGMLYLFGLLFGWNYQETLRPPVRLELPGDQRVCLHLRFPIPYVSAVCADFGTGVLHLPAGTTENIDYYSVAARGSGYGMCFRGIALLFPQIQHRRIGVRPIQVLHELAL